MEVPDFNSTKNCSLTYNYTQGSIGSSYVASNVSIIDENNLRLDDQLEDVDEVFEEAEDDTGDNVNPLEAEENEIVNDVVEKEEIVIMVDAALLNRHKTMVELMEWTVADDIARVDVEALDKSFLVKKIEKAQELQEKIRETGRYILEYDPEQYLQRYQKAVTDLRKVLSEFVIKAEARVTILNREASREVERPRNITERAQAAARNIKANSVFQYSTTAVAEMKELTESLKALKFSSATDQQAFRREEQSEKLLTKRIEAAKADANRLRADAVDSGMAEQAATLEETMRELNRQHKESTNLLHTQRRERNLLSTSGGSGSKVTVDISPPIFSGGDGGTLDYFKFSKELKEYEQVKSPSNEELLRIILTKCLRGEPKLACEHMTSKLQVMTYLSETYGDARLLINKVCSDIKKMGACSSDETKMRSWLLAVKNKLDYARALSEDHGVEQRLYFSRIANEVQDRLPPKAIDDFLVYLEGIDEGKELQPAKFYIELRKYLDKLVARCNYRLRLGVQINEVEYLGEKQQQPTDNSRRQPSNRQAPKRNYAVNSHEQEEARNYAISTKKEECRLCNEQHSYLYYCPVFQQAGFEERFDLARKAGNCFRCLISATTVEYEDRRAWFDQHKRGCETEWSCQIGKCGMRERSRQMSFLLCGWHAKKNEELEAKFVASLNKSEMKNKSVKFLFNVPMHMNWNLATGAAKPVQGWDMLPDVSEPSIFMLCKVMIDGLEFITFFDSGCMTASISQRAADLLDTQCITEGPTKISVASGKEHTIPGGEERFSIPLADGKTRCTVTAICMPEVTTSFPIWETTQATHDLERSYRLHYPAGPQLPVVPKSIGGCAIDIMLGIRYLRWFPQLIFMSDCGLSVYSSPFLCPEGENGVLAGPHRSWRHMVDATHSVVRIYSFCPSPVDRVEHHPQVEELEDAVDVHGDVIDQGGLRGEHDKDLFCKGQHCNIHVGRDWPPPLDPSRLTSPATPTTPPSPRTGSTGLLRGR